MKKLFKKYQEIIVYIFFGVLSTIVSWGSYAICERVFHCSVTVSNIISWVLAITFAFITNKLWVFNSKSFERKLLMTEITTFVSSRIVTGILELAGVPILAKLGFDTLFFNLCDKLGLEKIGVLYTAGIYSKIALSVIVVILNYVFSKLIVFRKESDTSSMKKKMHAFLQPIRAAAKPYYRKALCLVMSAYTIMGLYIDSAKFKFPKTVKDSPFSRYLPGRLYFHLKRAAGHYDVYAVLLMLALWFLYAKTPKFKGSKGEKAFAVFSSCLIPFMLLLCSSYNQIGSWRFVFGGEGALFLSFLKVTGGGLLVYSLICFLSNMNLMSQDRLQFTRRFDFKADFVKYAVLILVLWTPYMLLLYPGCFSPDSKDQLAQAFGVAKNCWSADAIVLLDKNVLLNTHHPPFYTLILYVTARFGQLIHSYTIAFELLCMAQAVTLAAAFSYTLCVMKKHGAKSALLLGAAAFFALNPLFPVYSMTVIKDTLYCAFMLAAVVTTYEMLVCETIGKLRLAAYFCIIMLFLVARNNSIYILILVLLFAVVTQWKKDKKRILKLGGVLLAAILVFQVGLVSAVYPALHISPGSKRELLSVPIQQTARYVSKYYDEVTQEEAEAILTVLNRDDATLKTIKQKYNPTFADPVKGLYNKRATTEDLVNYFKVWFAQFKKHPDCYMEAYLHLHYGWFSYEGHSQITYSKIEDKHIDSILKGFDTYMGKKTMRDVVNYAQYGLMKFPLTSPLFEMATYTWGYLLLLVYAIRRKRGKALLATSIVYFNYLICFVGPVPYMRYAVPMVCTLPFAAFITFAEDDSTLRTTAAIKRNLKRRTRHG